MLTRNTLGAIALGLSIVTPALAQTVDLTPTLEPGEPMRYGTEQRASQSQTGEAEGGMQLPEQKQTMSETSEFTIQVTAIDEESGNANVEVVYHVLKVDLEQGPMKLAYDSTLAAGEQAPNMLSSQLSGLVGKPIILSVSPMGKILSVDSSAVPQNQIVATFASEAQARGRFGAIFSTRHPSGTADVGDSWTHVEELDELAPGMAMTASLTYTLSASDDGEAHVEVDGDISSNNPAGGMMMLDSAEVEGKVVWDSEAGLATQVVGAQNFVMKLNQPGVTMTITAETKSKTARLDK
ncbi:MAG: DUF6263 family protein [Planctomycetota bacterium]